MRQLYFVLAPVVVFSVPLAATPTRGQVCDPSPLWQNTNHVTRATSDAQFGLGLSFVVTGPSLRAVWNESGSLPTPHVAGETRWVWSTGGASIDNFPNPVVLSSGNQEYVFVGCSNGRLYKIDAASGATVGSVDTRRSACPADQITATPIVQLYAYSNAVFRNDMDTMRGHPDDLVVVITKTGCGDQTSNRVIGFFGSDLTVKWTFNDPPSQSMGGANEGCTVNYNGNVLYCGTQVSLSTQPSLWALNSVSGALLWSYRAGSIKNRPMLNVSDLYVVSNGDHLQKHSAATGAIIWDFPFAPGATRSGSWQNRILVLDSAGEAHAIEDAGATAVPLWGPISPGGGLMYVSAPAIAPEHGRAYFGRNDGRVQQLDLSTGTPGIASSAITDSPVWDPTVDFSSPASPAADRLIVPHADGTIARYCIPWRDPTAVPEPLVESLGFKLATLPNPSTGSIRMEFALPFSAQVEIDVYTVSGQRVRSVLRSDRPAGRHEANWDGFDNAGRRPSAGIYFLRLRALDAEGQIHELSQKVQLLR